MTEHPNLPSIARLFPLFHIPYPNVIWKCPTEMSPNLLVCENINWCRISSICSFVPTHEELSIYLAFNIQNTCTLANCVTVHATTVPPLRHELLSPFCRGARHAPCAGRRFAGGAWWCSTADLRWPFGHAKRAAAWWVNLKRRKVAKESITGRVDFPV